MPDEIYGVMAVKNGKKQKIMNLSNARQKSYADLQTMTDAQKKGVIICPDYPKGQYLVQANQVGFDPTGTTLSSTDVEGAIKEVASTSNEAIGSTVIRRYGRLRTLSAMGGLVSGITSVTLASSDRPTNTVTVAAQVYANDNTTFVGNGFVKIGASDGSVSLTVNGAATSNTGRCYFTAVWIV